MTKFFRILLISVFTAITFTACSEDPENSTGSIYGNIYDNITNEALVGVSVKLTPSGSIVNTFSDGSFQFEDLQPGSYTLQFSKHGYDLESKTVEVVAMKSHMYPFRCARQ